MYKFEDVIYSLDMFHGLNPEDKVKIFCESVIVRSKKYVDGQLRLKSFIKEILENNYNFKECQEDEENKEICAKFLSTCLFWNLIILPSFLNLADWYEENEFFVNIEKSETFESEIKKVKNFPTGESAIEFFTNNTKMWDWEGVDKEMAKDFLNGILLAIK